MNKFEEYLSMAKISDFIHRKELEDEKKKTVCLVFAIIAGIAPLAAIAFLLVEHVSCGDDLNDVKYYFEYHLDDDFEDEEDDFVKEDEAAPAKDEE